MRTFTVGILTILSISLVDCAPSAGPTPPRPVSEPEWHDHGDDGIALSLAQNALVMCEDAHRCHPAVALLTLHDQNRTAQCSGFLIRPDLLLTNRHCVPEALQTSGASCKQGIFIAFPAIGRVPSRRVGCSEVIYSSPSHSEDPDSILHDPDYALLRLTEPVLDRIPLQVQGAGLPNEGLLTLYKVDPIDDGWLIAGVIRKDSCKVIQHSWIAPQFVDSGNPVGLVGDCPVRGGNSGSPLINSAGRAVGIVHGTLTSVQDVQALLGRDYLGETEGSPMGIVTNFACASALAPYEEGGRRRRCRSFGEAETFSFDAAIARGGHAAARTEMASLKNTWGFKWQFVMGWGLGDQVRLNPPLAEDEFLGLAAPECALRQYNWPKQKVGFSKVRVRVPLFRARPGYDKYFRYALHAVREKWVDAELFYSTEVGSRNAFPWMSASFIQLPASEPIPYFIGESLPWCPEGAK